MTRPNKQLSLLDVGVATDRISSWAIFDEGQRYRYRLWRVWDPSLPRFTWVMLNPSTADGTFDDNTIKSCRRITANAGGGGFDVVNLFAFIATHPEDMMAASRAGASIIGPENDRYIVEAVKGAGKVIIAWGAGVNATIRITEVLRLLYRQGPVYCLGLTKNGAPKHPLFVRGDAPLIALPGTGSTV